MYPGDVDKIIVSICVKYSEKNAKTSKVVKELSMNVAKALSKKLDIRDYKKLAKDRNDEILNYIKPSAESERKSKSLVENSRNLMNESQDNMFGYNSSDPNKEFDYLVQSMREGTESDFISEDDEEGTSAHFSPGRRSASAHTPYRQTPGLAAASANSRRSVHMSGAGAGGKTQRSASAGRAQHGASPLKQQQQRGIGMSGGGGEAESLRRMVDALLKQSERMEERLAIHQRELASLRESQRSSGGGGGGVNTSMASGGRSQPGSPTRMLNGSSYSHTLGKFHI